MSKVFRGAKAHYHKIERLTFLVVVAIRKFRPYFSETSDIGENRLPHMPSPQTPDLAKRMVSWVINLFEYDI